ncbi:MAG: SCO1664 family protein [Acidimicrobiales bacterium]
MTLGAGAAWGPDRRGAEPSGAPAPTEVLRRGDIDVHGRIAGSSNITLLVTCTLGKHAVPAVYKPVRGERPLWDFPPGLHRREVAAGALSDALGWGLVPETVLREDAPYGTGSLQRVVAEDGESHYFTLRQEVSWHPLLRRIAAFDVVINNADRKSGHVLLAEGTLWAIDHGLAFHPEPKLRTVIWDFAGEPLADDDAADLRRLAGGLPPGMEELLDGAEQEATLGRARRLLAAGALPAPGHERPYPWPLV